MRPSCAPHAPGRAEGQIESETPADMPAGVSNEGLTWSGVRTSLLYGRNYFMSTYLALIHPRSVLYHASAIGTSSPSLYVPIII